MDMSAKRDVENENIKTLTVVLGGSPSRMYIQGFGGEV